MKILIINGESDWGAFLPGCEVRQVRLQNTGFALYKGRLQVRTAQDFFSPKGILWRLGAVRPEPHHRTVLELIRLSQTPCVNGAPTLLRGYDRLSMLAELREIGMPLLPFDVFAGDGVWEEFGTPLPAVVKIGNYHGGWGKARLQTPEQLGDARDLAFAAKDYLSVEPFVDYARDIRVLGIGEQFWAMSRRSEGWKVNRGVADFELLTPFEPLLGWTKRAMAHLNADILAIDFLETQNGEFLALESNDIPGLSGFPGETRHALAAILRAKIEASR